MDKHEVDTLQRTPASVSDLICFCCNWMFRSCSHGRK